MHHAYVKKRVGIIFKIDFEKFHDKVNGRNLLPTGVAKHPFASQHVPPLSNLIIAPPHVLTTLCTWV
jgi:hypothetical protein